jgi:aspartate/methionine/tyrosine aminotransferase
MQTSVFERMSSLAVKHGAVNLGQGFPDFGWPDEILDAAARALKDGSASLRERPKHWRRASSPLSVRAMR